MPLPVITLGNLPQGTFAEPCDAPGIKDEKGKTMRGANYHLPDGRQCLVIDTTNPHPEDDLISAYRFQYRDREGSWAYAIVSVSLESADAGKLAVDIKNSAQKPSQGSSPAVIMAARTAPSDTVLPLLGVGAAAQPVLTDNARDSSGGALHATEYHLPDGRVCRVVDVAVHATAISAGDTTPPTAQK